jgi:hypothetical protein
MLPAELTIPAVVAAFSGALSPIFEAWPIVSDLLTANATLRRSIPMGTTTENHPSDASDIETGLGVDRTTRCS